MVKAHPGIYEIDGREVAIDQNLNVLDGPMRQPLSDYLTATEANVEYESDVKMTSALHHIPRERRITFDDRENPYRHQKMSRLQAMKIAKEQASIREKAAEMQLRPADETFEALKSAYHRAQSRDVDEYAVENDENQHPNVQRDSWESGKPSGKLRPKPLSARGPRKPHAQAPRGFSLEQLWSDGASTPQPQAVQRQSPQCFSWLPPCRNPVRATMSYADAGRSASWDGAMAAANPRSQLVASSPAVRVASFSRSVSMDGRMTPGPPPPRSPFGQQQQRMMPRISSHMSSSTNRGLPVATSFSSTNGGFPVATSFAPPLLIAQPIPQAVVIA